MDLELDGQCAIVTGASKGIGFATALELVREGVDVAICGRGATALEQAREALLVHDRRVHASQCDVGDADQLQSFLTEARDALGRVDILVNNASALAEADDEDSWRASVDVDLLASVRATRTVTPWMSEVGGGSIIHVSSISGLEPGSPVAYAAVKAALFNHARTLADELAAEHIRVNCIAPGSIHFEGGLWDEVKNDQPEEFASVVADIPFGRMGTPEEVAAAVVFLASPRASWITGTRLIVDGGQHKGL